jgi:hypothetical protein
MPDKDLVDICNLTVNDVSNDIVTYIDCCENCNRYERIKWNKHYCTLLKKYVFFIEKKDTDCPYF